MVGPNMNSIAMRSVIGRVGLWILACAGWLLPATAAQEFPLQAMVVRDGAIVYSGPGAMHYGTAELEQGALVEVWRFDPGDWCAIRPDEGSFCLVPESGINDEGGGAGSVIEDGLQVWVGTRLGPVEKPLWQVKLARGEQVEILGRSSWPSPEGAPTAWLQIAPPAGEFRWMKRSDLQLPDDKTSLPIRRGSTPAGGVARDVARAGFEQDLNSPDATAQLDDPFAGVAVGPLVNRVEEASSDYLAGEQAELLPGRLPPRDAGWRPARRPFQTGPDRSPDVANGNPGVAPPPGAGWNASASPSGPDRRGSVNPAPQLASLPIDRLADQQAATQPTFGGERLVPALAELDLRISAEIVKPAEYWDLDGLASDMVRAQATAATDGERDQAARLVRKIDQLRATRASLLGGRSSATVPAIASTGRAVGSGVDTDVELGATYDAHGWLNELVQQNGETGVTYVLQDESGRITHHIGAEPGLNLHRYLKQRIGIVGQRGYNQRLKLSHVTAERVVVLESNPLTTASRF